MTELYKAVKAGADQGKKLEELQASVKLPDSVGTWVGNSLKSQVKDAYNEITKAEIVERAHYFFPRPLAFAFGAGASTGGAGASSTATGSSISGMATSAITSSGFTATAVSGADLFQHFREQRGFARIHLGRRRLLVTEVVIAMAGAASNFGGLRIHDGHHRVVHNPLTPDAKIVDIVAQTHFAHIRSPSWRSFARRVRARLDAASLPE